MMQFRKLAILVLTLGLAVSAAGCEDPLGPIDAPVVTAAYDGAAGVVILSWSAVTGASSYTVRRSTNGDNFATLAGGIAETTYTDATVSEGNSYIYIVIAEGDDDTEASEPRSVVIGLREAVLSGTLATRTLSSDTTYYLNGVVTVPDGVTLTVEPGTLILGDASVQPTALIIMQGGMIDARGTVDEPIIFTSSRPAGERRRGDWGGVVLNGYGVCNFPDADDCIAEGFAATYGGTDDADNSGILRYVRIEFAGFEVSLGNELNVLTLNGVGSGTTLEYIQAHQGLDDGIEWFGGAVDLKYALVTGASDDSFDYSTGWHGRGQFWIALQDPDDADTGFEVDNNSDPNALPRTDPMIYNVTLVGKGATGTAGESTTGLKLRLGTAGEIRNAIVMGFGTAGLDIDNAETAAQCTAGELIVANSIFFGNAKNFDDDDTYQDTCLAQAGWVGLLTSDPELGDPYNWGAANFQPAAGSPAANAANAATPSDAWFTAAAYIGAVDPAATGPLWYEGWTTFEKTAGQN